MTKQNKTTLTILIILLVGGAALVACLALAGILLARQQSNINLQEPTVTALDMKLPKEIKDAHGMRMRLVTAGEFNMGSNDMHAGVAAPEHKVTLAKSFYMDIFEVSRASYKECMQAGGCSAPKDIPSPGLFFSQGNFPMSGVDWNQAKSYCAWRGGRLPGETEWEKAARGTDGRIYPWGNEFDTRYVGESYNQADGVGAVGSYPENISPYGLYDMAGSLWEWTADVFQAYPGNKEDANAYQGQIILRGGASHFGDPYSLASWFRFVSFPEDEENYIGFRCARDAEP